LQSVYNKHYSKFKFKNSKSVEIELAKGKRTVLMMKRLIMLCVTAIAALVFGGCAHPKPDFNQTYLPKTAPGSPERRIELTTAVVNKATKNGTEVKARHLSLYWIENDDLLVSVLSKDRRKVSYSFLVSYSTGQVKAIEDAEKDALLSKIEKKVSADKKGSSVGEFIGLIVQATITIAAGGGGGSGSGGGSRFLGNIENNGYVLDIDATVDRRSKWSIFPSSYECSYKIKNRQSGETLKGKAVIDKLGEEQASAVNWLKSWRISPDGRLYLIGQTATLIDSENNEDTVHALIENYSYAALDVSPKWDEIALLMIKVDEKTKQKSYWIEFYPFDYRKVGDKQP
jgi:hypothetical protein